MKNVIELVAKEKTYSGRELAEILGVGASTLRKWSMLLEQQGYRFLRDSQNRREYRQSDVDALRSFYQLTKENLMPLEEAARTVAGRTSFQQTKRETAASLSLVPPVVPSRRLCTFPVKPFGCTVCEHIRCFGSSDQRPCRSAGRENPLSRPACTASGCSSDGADGTLGKAGSVHPQ